MCRCAQSKKYVAGLTPDKNKRRLQLEGVRQQRYATTHPFYWIAKILRNRGKRTSRKVEVDATFLEQLWNKQKGLCALTGQKMRLDIIEKVGWKFQKDRVSVDRIDSSQDYVPGNIQLILAGVNIAKNARSQEEFIEMCKAVAAHCQQRVI